MAGTQIRASYRDVFQIREFRALWLAELLSIGGDQLARIALSVLVFNSTRSAALTGLTYALTFVPSLVGGVVLSGIADRLPRRSVMVAVDLLRAALILLVAVPGTPFWLLCVLVGSVSLVNPLFKAAQLALLPAVLPGDRYAVGMAVQSMTLQSAQLLGFAGGGLLIATLGVPRALLIDAGTFLASALLIRLGTRRRPAATTAEHHRTGWLSSLRRGARLAYADRGIRTLLSLNWMMAVITVYEGLAAPYAAAFGGGPVVVGVLLASDPFGGVIGAYVFGRFVPTQVRLKVVGWLAVGAAAALVPCLLRPNLLLSILLFVLSGALGTTVVMQATTSLTVAVPDSSRGQMLGLSHTGVTAVTGLSPLLGGVLADVIGPARTVGWFGLSCVVLLLPLAVAWRRALHDNASQWDPAAT